MLNAFPIDLGDRSVFATNEVAIDAIQENLDKIEEMWNEIYARDFSREVIRLSVRERR